MRAGDPLFIIRLDHQRYALELEAVDRVVRMVEVTAMPKSPPSVLGVINVQGEVLPVIDLRACLGHRQRHVEPQDVLVITESAGRKAALAADEVGGVMPGESQVVLDQEMLRRSDFVEGVVKLDDGLVMVFDLGKIMATCGTVGPAKEDFFLPAATVPPTEGAFGGEAGERLRILRARARRLAIEPAMEEVSQRLEIVEFALSDEEYAFESAFIREVYPLRELTPLPCTPPFVLGVVNLRGKILSVIDLRKFFELPEKGLSDLNKLIVLQDGAMEFGILADSIVGVRNILAKELQPSLPTLTDMRADYLRGVTRERLVVLDAGKMLTDKRIIVHEEV